MTFKSLVFVGNCFSTQVMAPMSRVQGSITGIAGKCGLGWGQGCAKVFISNGGCAWEIIFDHGLGLEFSSKNWCMCKLIQL